MDVERYRGPVIDAATHLWKLDQGKYPWLSPAGSFGPKGRFDGLKGKDYSLADYRGDTEVIDLAGSVHVEALWDPDDDPVNETLWLESLESSRTEAVRYVGGANFTAEDVEDVVARQAAFDRLVAIRQTIAWTPYPQWRMAPAGDLTRTAAWQRGCEAAVRHGLHLEFLLYPWQDDDILRIARTYEDSTVIVDHIASPIDQSEAGLERWRRAVDVMASTPNVVIKMSAAAGYLAERSPQNIRPFVQRVVGAFGANRVMFGSDLPVAKLTGWSLGTYFDAYCLSLADRTEAEKSAIFYNTARRVYGFDALGLPKLD